MLLHPGDNLTVGTAYPRLLLVKYKGAYDADTADTAEKQTVGQLWELKSEGAGPFLVADNRVYGRDMRRQFTDEVNIA